MRSSTDFCAPRPSAIIAMTAPTPMTMPSIVRKERSLFARSAPNATARISPSSMLRPAAARTSAAARSRRHSSAGLAHARQAAAAHVPEAVVCLIALDLHGGGAEQRYLLAILQSRDDLGIVVVAHAKHDEAWREGLSFLDEHEAGARTRPRSSRWASGLLALWLDG